MNKREKVFNKTNGKCIYCGCDIDIKTFHIEHMKPKSTLKIDKDHIDNLYPSCKDCNLSKGNLTIEEFRKKLEKMPFMLHIARMITKYYDVKPRKITFYFEKENIK